MNKRTIILIVIAIIIAIIIGIFIATRQNQNNQETLKVIKVNEVTRSVFYAPQYVAISNGYFKEKGMDVELTTGQGADAVMTAVLAGQCDIGFARPRGFNLCL